MLHPQSQLEPPTDFKNLLKVFFTVASLWWLLWLQLFHSSKFQIYFETLWFGEIEKTWVQNPSCINGVFLSLRTLLIDVLWFPLNTGSNESQFGFQTNTLQAFSRCWFLMIREARSIELLSSFYREQNLDLSSCYRGDSKFQLLSSCYQGTCWKCVLLSFSWVNFVFLTWSPIITLRHIKTQ